MNETGRLYYVKVKQPDMTRWLFLGQGGCLVTRRARALMFAKGEAERVAGAVRSGGDQAKVT